MYVGALTALVPQRKLCQVEREGFASLWVAMAAKLCVRLQMQRDAAVIESVLLWSA